MKRKERILLIFAGLLLCAAALGLYSYRGAVGESKPTGEQAAALQGAEPSGPKATLIISRDYGREEIKRTEAPLQDGDMVMDILKRHGGEIKTSYNGSFVDAIAGVESAYRVGDSSSKKQDWFFYVNGIMAEVGAAEYPVAAGDVITWDYHDWDFSISTPALIGVYPQPFAAASASGDAPAAVMYAPGYEEAARLIRDKLAQTVTQAPELLPWEESQFGSDRAVVAVGDTRTFGTSPFYQQLWNERGMYGLYAHFTDQGIKALDSRGNPVDFDAEGDVGAVISSIHPETRRPLWMIAGTTPQAVQNAAASLDPDQANYRWSGFVGVILNGDKVIRLPMVPGGGTTP